MSNSENRHPEKGRKGTPPSRQAPAGGVHSVTINDIARATGVSKATVSRVLNNSPKVSAATRERVMDAIRRANFEPSSVARNLARRSTSTIGVLLEDIYNPFFTELAKGAESVLSAHGYTMLLTRSGWTAERELEIVRLLVRQRVDGIVVAPLTPNSPGVRLIADSGIPFVLANCRSSNPGDSWVTTDNLKGGYLATRYAIHLGYTRILCLHDFEHQTTFERTEGYLKAISEEGGRIEALVVPAVRAEEEGAQIVRSLIDHGLLTKEPTAVFALNDQVAMSVIDGLLELGYRVPEDVSVIGFDDIRFAGRFRIPLTTVAQAKFAMGEIAAREMLRQIDDMKSGNVPRPMTHLLEPQLVVRASTRGVTSGA